MKINDVIHKCLETPGISMRRDEYSTELMLNTKDGKGSMTFFPLFPGITLAYIFVNASVWQAPDMADKAPNGKGMLLFNYCVEGRCELVLNNQNYVYVKDNEISLTEHFAGKQYVYPRHIYEGLEFFIDGDTVSEQCSYVQEEFGIFSGRSLNCIVRMKVLILRRFRVRLQISCADFGNCLIFRCLLRWRR